MRNLIEAVFININKNCEAFGNFSWQILKAKQFLLDNKNFLKKILDFFKKIVILYIESENKNCEASTKSQIYLTEPLSEAVF